MTRLKAPLSSSVCLLNGAHMQWEFKEFALVKGNMANQFPVPDHDQSLEYGVLGVQGANLGIQVHLP